MNYQEILEVKLEQKQKDEFQACVPVLFSSMKSNTKSKKMRILVAVNASIKMR